jgi:hypothetical protein
VAHANFTGTNKIQIVCMHKRLIVKGVLKCLLKEGVTQLVKVTYGSWKKRNKEPPENKFFILLMSIAKRKC